MDTKQLTDLVKTVLEDMKAQNIVTMDVRELTPMADSMIIATGTSSTHIKSLSEEVSQKVKQAGGTVNGMEGREQAEWVLVDLGSVIVHIMLAPTRALYSLEDLWNFSSIDRIGKEGGEN